MLGRLCPHKPPSSWGALPPSPPHHTGAVPPGPTGYRVYLVLAFLNSVSISENENFVGRNNFITFQNISHLLGHFFWPLLKGGGWGSACRSLVHGHIISSETSYCLIFIGKYYIHRFWANHLFVLLFCTWANHQRRFWAPFDM